MPSSLKMAMLLLMAFWVCHGLEEQDFRPFFSFNGTLNRDKRRAPRPKPRRLMDMTGPEIIHSRGYPVEVHKVITKDGYILEMHRIKGPHKYFRNVQGLPGNRRAVYIQHCVLCSSFDFIMNDAHQALPYVLADAGFDVWLGNYRGNVYSRKHLYLNPDEPMFWKFSFMEMAHYDIPAMIYYMLEKTGQRNISYIGHSMGTTGLFAANSLMPELNRKVRVMAAMAPVAYLDHIRGPMRHLFTLAKYSYRFKEKINKAEVQARSRLQSSLSGAFCKPGGFFIKFCQAILPGIVGGPNSGYINEKYIQAVLTNTPAGTSARTLAHLGQLVDAGGFQMFDYGPEENLRFYGMKTAPPYDLGKTVIPVGLFWSDNDYVSSPKDVELVAKDLPNVTLNYRVPLEDFNHMDFLFAADARKLVYDRILQFLLDH